MAHTNPLLQRPLYVYDLPERILTDLSLKFDQAKFVDVKSETPSQPESMAADAHELGEATAQQPETSKATSCNLCSLNFTNVQEQRSHVKSDHHNYNLKQRLKGVKPVSELDFEKLIGELDESISGSDTETASEDEDDGTNTTLSSVLKRQAKLAHADEDVIKKSTAGQPIVWLGTPGLPANVSLGVYRALFDPRDLDHVVEVLRQKQLKPVAQPSRKNKSQTQSTTDQGPTWFLCMIGGGHFAAMVVSLVPKLVNNHKGAGERQAIVLAHKTFHRYTTRRKQGGSQSTSDAAKGAAHSAGSSLRRANEAALTNEIRALLSEWKTLIDACELVFVRATGSNNRRTLFGPYEGQVLRNNDPRNRGFPFTTRRATQSELMRCFTELTRVKISHIDEAALAAEAAARDNVTAKPVIQKPASKPSKPGNEEQILHSNQISNLIKRSKVPGLIAYINTNKIDLKTFVLEPAQQFYHTPTPLHLASSLGHVPIISALLTRCGADPTQLNDDAKTAYDIAKDRSSRDTFRQARHSLGEAAWNWDQANVGSALSPDEVATRDASDKQNADIEAKKEAERRKVETERLRKEEKAKEDVDRVKRIGHGRSLGEMTGAEKRELEGRGMTPEMRMKLERERRARAAEERMRRT